MRMHEIAIFKLVDNEYQTKPVILCSFSQHRIVQGMRLRIGLFLIRIGLIILYGNRGWFHEVRHI